MVKSAREERGWTQQMLADKLHKSRVGISLLEGKTEVPGKMMKELDRVFGGPTWRKTTNARGGMAGDSNMLNTLLARIIDLEDQVAAFQLWQEDVVKTRGLPPPRTVKKTLGRHLPQ
jgi:transcriptional regulator with XRE-family HTH domain